VTYSPRSDGSRWAKDQIVAALRVHGELSTRQLADTIGCRATTLLGAIMGMLRSGELRRWRDGTSGIWQNSLGDAVAPPVDVEQFEQFPLEWEGET
jgi:hypothetical protein